MGGGSEERVISTAPFQAMSELLRVGDTTEVDEGSFHHQDMGDLMSTPWKHMSNFPGKKRSAMCAAQRPTLVTYIRAMRKNQPSGPPWTLMKSSETVNCMAGRTPLKLSPRNVPALGCRCLGVGNRPHCATTKAEMPGTQTMDADEPWLWGAVEGVVEPGAKAPHNQQGNPCITQF